MATTRAQSVAQVQQSSGGPVPPQAAGKNAIINGAFNVWQRGTSISVAASSSQTYTTDRWYLVTGANQACTYSRQATGDTTNLPNIQYAARIQRNSGQTGTSFIYTAQACETATSIPFTGKTVTISFYARAGANFSASSNLLAVYLYTGTGTDQNIGTYTGSATPIAQSVTLTTTWQRFSITGTIASTATEMSPLIGYTPVGTASTNDYFEITGIQLEIGSTATAFQTASGTIQGELALCQRYFLSKTIGGANMAIGGSSYYATTSAQSTVVFPVTMRVSPTIVQTTGTNYYGMVANGGIDSFNSLTIDATGTNQVVVYNNTEMAGIAGTAGFFIIQNASGSLAFSAEL